MSSVIQEFICQSFQLMSSTLDVTIKEFEGKYERWIEEFLPSAKEQLKSINNEPWRPVTPKKTTRARRSSKLTKNLAEQNEERQDLNTESKPVVFLEPPAPKPKKKRLSKASKLKASSEHEQNNQTQTSTDGNTLMVPPEATSSKESLPGRKRSARVSKRLAQSTTKRQSRDNMTSMHLFLDSASTEESETDERATEKKRNTDKVNEVAVSSQNKENRSPLKDSNVKTETASAAAINSRETFVLSKNTNSNTPSNTTIYNTPRVPVTLQTNRTLNISMLNSPKTHSPKQLFSPFTKGDIKEKALAFEMANQSDGGSCTRQGKRKLLATGEDHLKPETIPRRSTRLSSRRSSLKRREDQHLNSSKEAETSSDVIGPSETDDTPEPKRASLQNTESPDVQEEELNSVATPELTDQGPTVASTSGKKLTKQDVPDCRLVLSPLNLKKFQGASSGSLQKQNINRPLPASETRMFQKNRVADLVSKFSKQSASAERSMGKSRLSAGRKGSINSGMYSNILSGFKHFPKATVIKTTTKTSRDVLLDIKRAKEEDAVLKRQKLLKEKTEETKRKNEEKQQKVREKRMKEQQASEKLRRTLERQEQLQLAAKKTADDKKRSYLEAKKTLRLKREMELEKRRKEELLKQKELEEQRKMALIKKQLEKEQEAKQAAAAAAFVAPSTSTSANPKPKQVSVLNQTYTADQSTDGNNYDITPHRSELPKEELIDPNNYDIDDLKSDDGTDDEQDPRKKIPNWAQGVTLRIAIINQHRNPPDLKKLFPPIDTCNLDELFTVKRSRFKVRTSSGIWDVAPLS